MRPSALAFALTAALAACDSKEPSKSPGGGGSIPMAEPAKPGKHMWSGFPKGSFVKLKTVTETDIAGTRSRTEITRTHTLKELSPDSAVIETVTVMTDVPAPSQSEEKIPLKARFDVSKGKNGSEELEIAGARLKCSWTETEADDGGNRAVTRVWQNEEVPGFIVKTVTKSPTMTSTMEVVEYRSK
jgi:hypothetical protein